MTASRIFLTHQTACKFWVHRDLHETLSSRAVPSNSDTQNAVALNDIRHLIIGAKEHEPIHASVTNANNRHHMTGAVLHHRTVPYPRQSFRKIARDTFVACPELCFLNAASLLSFEELVLYGMELCGTYARTGVEWSTRYKRACLTSTRKIAAYLNKSAGANGVKVALAASKHLLNGSASPRESVLASMMTLPGHKGGFGLPKPQLNYGKKVAAPNKLAPGKPLILHGDLTWPEARLVVEYDGEQHGQEDNHASDKQRDHLLLEAGFEVVRITDKSIRSGEELERLARTINRKAHLHKRKEQLQWNSQRELLLDSMLHRSTPPWL